MSTERELTIDPVHNGPPDSAHGGVAAGRMAEQIDPLRARVRFHAPIPVGSTMTAVPGGDNTVELFEKDRSIAVVRRLEDPLDVERFEPLPPTAVDAAEQAFRSEWGTRHPFPTCFGCGHHRTDGRGMALAPGPAPGHHVHAAWWRPRSDGAVPPWLVWAALDCPSGFPAFVGMAPDRARVTGEFAVELLHPVPRTPPTRSSRM